MSKDINLVVTPEQLRTIRNALISYTIAMEGKRDRAIDNETWGIVKDCQSQLKDCMYLRNEIAPLTGETDV